MPTDNPYFKKNKYAHVTEKKFFEQKNMPSIRAQVPIQYTSIDGVTPKGFTERGSLLANYIGGSQSATYRKIGIGFGDKVDFTKISGAKADFTHDYERMYSMKN